MDHSYKCYEGSRRLNPKGHLPLLIVVAQRDAEKGYGFSEHYIFTGLEKPSFLRSSTGYEASRNVSIENFNDVVTLDAMLASQSDRAKAHLESEVFQLDKERHQIVFWAGQNYEYLESDDTAFFQLALRRASEKEIAEMFERTQSQALEVLERRWKVIRKFNVKVD